MSKDSTAKSPKPTKPTVVVQPTILPDEPPISVNTNSSSGSDREVPESSGSERRNVSGPSSPGPMFGGHGMPGMPGTTGMPGMPEMPRMPGMAGMPGMPGPSEIHMPAFGIPHIPIPEIPGMPGFAANLQARMDDAQARFQHAQALMGQHGLGPQQLPGHGQRGESSSSDSLSSSSSSSSSSPSSSDSSWPGAGTPFHSGWDPLTGANRRRPASRHRNGATPPQRGRRSHSHHRHGANPARRGGRHAPPAPPRG